jgi:hypothetical protein
MSVVTGRPDFQPNTHTHTHTYNGIREEILRFNSIFSAPKLLARKTRGDWKP